MIFTLLIQLLVLGAVAWLILFMFEPQGKVRVGVMFFFLIIALVLVARAFGVWI